MVQNDINMKHYTEEWLLRHAPDVYMPMLYTADNVAKKYDVSRERQDEYAFQSQQRTAAAQAAGRFDAEIVPLPSWKYNADKETGAVSEEHVELKKDEGNRADTTLEGLQSLKGAVPGIKETSITAGNSSQLSDGAAAVVLMDSKLAQERGLAPLGIYRGFVVAGCEPGEMGIGPVYAIPKLLDRHGLKIDDIGLWELNEAFAVQTVYCRDYARHSERPLQRRRRRDLDRPPVRHERRAHDHARPDRRQAPRRQVRRRHDVRRRRHGRRRPVRGRLTPLCHRERSAYAHDDTGGCGGGATARCKGTVAYLYPKYAPIA